MSERPPFPAVVDSSMIAAFRACPQRAFRTYLEHWKPKGESVHLVAGKAFAEGIETARHAFWEEGLDAKDALGKGCAALLKAYGNFECPEESPKSADRMLGALVFYVDERPLADMPPMKLPSGRYAIEFSFAEPLDCLHPETGDPILYSGRADMIGHYAGGLYIVDEKTTTSLGARWQNQWSLRSQFTAYCWAARRVGIPVDGVLVSGVSILKTKYDHQIVPTNRLPWEIERWEHQTHKDLNKMIECWKSGYWDWNMDSACTEYGGCVLREVCKSPEPERWLPMYFERKKWDPLARTETVL